LNERFQPDITHGWVEGMKKTVARLSVFVFDCRGDGCMFAIEAERGDEKRCIFASEAVQLVQEYCITQSSMKQEFPPENERDPR
jgi:adenosylmethionine-8-amino-7-oxononanoate aminotransferase